MSRLVLGFLCGAFLCGLRMPLGRELLEIPAVPAQEAYLVRGLALATVAVALLFARRSLDGRPHVGLLFGAALGFAAEGLVGRLHVEAASSAYPLVPVALVLLLWREMRHPVTEETPANASLPALGMCGVGLAIGLEGLARHLRLLGGGLASDDSVFGAVLLGAMAFGALAFAAPLRGSSEGARDRAAGPTVHLVLAIAGGALLLGLVAMRGVATPRGLRAFLERFGLDASLYGQVATDGLLAAVVFVIPAFAAGTALVCARRRVELCALLVGAAIGLQEVPQLLAPDPGAAFDELRYNALLVRMGVFVVGVGVLVGTLRSTRGLHFPVGIGCALTLLALGLFVPVQHVKVLKAWTRFPVPFAEIFDIPEGQILIQPSAPGVESVTLDHRPLTPVAAGARADAEVLRTSLALLDPERPAAPRVLLVGQLTPGRALVLRDEGVGTLDRTAAWWDVMERLEARLFAGREEALPAAGDVLSLSVARERFEAGEYDLVIVPPVPGRVPLVPRVSPPAGTVAVAWFDAGSAVARRRITRPVVLSSDGFEQPSIGVVWGIELETLPVPDRPAAVLAGSPGERPRTWTWMTERHDVRTAGSRAELFARLAAANAENDWRYLTQALAAHHAAQEPSSPWETVAQRTELVPETLEELTQAATLGAPDRMTRELWNGIAAVLVGKRDVEAIYTWIEPVSQIWAPWADLELALAHADVESLDPESAIARLVPLLRERPDDFVLAELLAKAHGQANDTAAALDVWRALQLQSPADRRAKRALVLALVAAGETQEARPLLEELLRDDPEDRELWGLLTPRGPEDGD